MVAPVGTVTGRQLRGLLEKQAYHCAYTGEPLDPETASLDHVNPATHGGGHGIDNLAIVQHHVNQAKGAMTLAAFVALCRSVVEHFEGWEEGDPLPRHVMATT